MTLPTIDRRKLARAYDVFLIAAGSVVLYLSTDPAAKAYLAELGGWVTIAIGVLNILLNRLQPLLAKLPKDPPA